MDNARLPVRPPRGAALAMVLVVLLCLSGWAALAPQVRTAMPSVLPAWTPWIAVGAIAALLPWSLRRHWIRIAGDEIEMRTASGRERFELRAVRRIELAPYSGRYDIYVMLKGGGVRRVAARDLSDPDGVVTALGARGVPIVRL